MLDELKPSLSSSLHVLDDFDEGDRFDVVLKLLPRVDARFLPFDDAMVKDLLDHFQCVGDGEDDQVIPSYWSEWQHATTYYLMDKGGDIGKRYLTFIRIRRDASAQPRLDDLIWMGHEVGHQLIYRHMELLVSLFEPAWQQFEGDMAQAKLTARGRALELAVEREKLMERYWKPAAEEANWTHELVIDALCVWVFGPAYLWAFVHEHIEDPQRYELHQMDMHPPRRLRAEAMNEAARHLGWTEVDALRPLLEAWQATPADAGESNRYTAFRKPYLVQGVHHAAFVIASQLGIPQLTPHEFMTLDPAAAIDGDPSARDVILSAWKQRQTLSTVAELERWESSVITQALSAIVVGS
jgi:hypothetical protein